MKITPANRPSWQLSAAQYKNSAYRNRNTGAGPGFGLHIPLDVCLNKCVLANGKSNNWPTRAAGTWLQEYPHLLYADVVHNTAGIKEVMQQLVAN